MAKSSKQPAADEAPAPVVAPIQSVPVAEVPAPVVETADEAPAPKIEVGLEAVALIVAEPVPGIRRYITGITDDGRILAGDTREDAELTPSEAKAIIKAVRKEFPNAEIQLVLA